MSPAGPLLIVAVRSADCDLALRLLQSGEHVNQLADDGQTALAIVVRRLVSHLAIDASRHPQYSCLFWHLLGYGADIDAARSRSLSALWLACRAGRVDIVDALLRYSHHSGWFSPPTEARRRQRRTVHLSGGWRTHIQVFVDRSSPELVWKSYEDSLTPIMAAASAGHVAVVRLLIDAGRAGRVDDVDRFGDSVLHLLVMNLNARLADDTAFWIVETIVALLANYGRRAVNAVDDDGMTPLYMAVRNNSPLACRVLLDHGADPNIGRSVQWMSTPLAAACYLDSVELVEMLLSAGADPNGLARRAGEPFKFDEDLVELYCADKRTFRCRLPLRFAADRCNERLMRRLIDAGADVNRLDGDGLTALHCLVQIDVIPPNDIDEEDIGGGFDDNDDHDGLLLSDDEDSSEDSSEDDEEADNGSDDLDEETGEAFDNIDREIHNNDAENEDAKSDEEVEEKQNEKVKAEPRDIGLANDYMEFHKEVLNERDENVEDWEKMDETNKDEDYNNVKVRMKNEEKIEDARDNDDSGIHTNSDEIGDVGKEITDNDDEVKDGMEQEDDDGEKEMQGEEKSAINDDEEQTENEDDHQKEEMSENEENVKYKNDDEKKLGGSAFEDMPIAVRLRLIQILIDAGADTNRRNRNGFKPLHYLAAHISQIRRFAYSQYIPFPAISEFRDSVSAVFEAMFERCDGRGSRTDVRAGSSIRLSDLLLHCDRQTAELMQRMLAAGVGLRTLAVFCKGAFRDRRRCPRVSVDLCLSAVELIGYRIRRSDVDEFRRRALTAKSVENRSTLERFADILEDGFDVPQNLERQCVISIRRRLAVVGKHRESMSAMIDRLFPDKCKFNKLLRGAT